MEQTLIKVNEMLLKILGSKELLDKWWVSPNKAFYLEAPIEVFDKDPEAVLTYVESFYAR